MSSQEKAGLSAEEIYQKAQDNVISNLRGTDLEYLIPAQRLETPFAPLELASSEQWAQKAFAQEQADERIFRQAGGWNADTGGLNLGLPKMTTQPVGMMERITGAITSTVARDLRAIGIGEQPDGITTTAPIALPAAIVGGKIGGSLVKNWVAGFTKSEWKRIAAGAAATYGITKLLNRGSSSKKTMAENYGGYGAGFDWGDVLQLATPGFLEDNFGLGSGNRRKSYRRMNPMNYKAAMRATRRIKGSLKVLRKIERQLPKQKSKAACKKRC